MKKKSAMKSHNIYIDEKQWKRVVYAADKQEKSAASIVREAIKYFLDCRGY